MKRDLSSTDLQWERCGADSERNARRVSKETSFHFTYIYLFPYTYVSFHIHRSPWTHAAHFFLNQRVYETRPMYMERDLYI